MKVKPLAFLFLAITLAATTLLGINIQLTNTHEPTPDWARLAAHGRDQFLTPQNSQAAKQRAVASYGKVPLSFESNQGQTDRRVKFLSRGHGYTLFLTPTEAVLALSKSQAQTEPNAPIRSRCLQREKTTTTALRLKLVGANLKPRVEGIDELPGKSTYFIGNDPKKWRTNVPNYARVRYRSVYPGVDLVYYGNQRQLEHDFEVEPGADPGAIHLAVSGSRRIQVDKQGDLKLEVSGDEVRLQRPLVYQVVDGVRREVSGNYALMNSHEFGFRLGEYDSSRPLVIDPVLIYSTYLGGSGNEDFFDLGDHSHWPAGITADVAGNAYVTGSTSSLNFPTTSGSFQTVHGGSDFPCNRGFDAFVTKLNPTGSGLVYSTYLGGSGDDFGSGVAVDAAGNAYVTGFTKSANFPTTPGAFQIAHSGQTCTTGGCLCYAAFVTKLSPTGTSLVYSTYLGGNHDLANGIAVDAAGNAYVTGASGSPSFPTTPGAFQPTPSGSDAFVTKLNPTGSGLVYSTFLGGSNFEEGSGIALDAAGNAYITGFTQSVDFPTTMGSFQTAFGGGFRDAFVTKLNPTGSALVYSTYLGGSGTDQALGIVVDTVGAAYVTGFTMSSNFPTTPGSFQTAFGGGTRGDCLPFFETVPDCGSMDAFVTKLNPTGSLLVYSTYLGGSRNDAGFSVTVDTVGNSYITGSTSSFDFPVANPIQATLGGGFGS